MRTRRARPTKSLADQLPESGFPSGVGAPSLCVLVMLLVLAALTGVLLDGRGRGGVPRAFTQSQERLAAGAARTIGAAANQNLGDLRIAATGQAATPEALLDALVRNRRWRGAVVLNDADRALVAARGEQVPAEALPDGPITDWSVTPVIAANGEPHLVTAVPLPSSRLLVATSTVRLPDVGPGDDLRQSLMLTTTGGSAVSAAVGSPPGPELADLVRRAGQDAARGTPGSLPGPTAEGRQATLAYARVAPAGNENALDLAVVAVAYGPVSAASSGWEGVVPAAALALLALGGYLLIRRGLVAPVRRARRDALAVAGGDLDHAPARQAPGEVGRIDSAIAASRAALRGEEGVPAPIRGGPRPLTAVLVASLAVLAWSGTVAVLLSAPGTDVPNAIVASSRNQTAGATESLRRSMNDGLADLEALATSGPETVDSALDLIIADQTRYRSVYLVDRDGTMSNHRGRPPLRANEPIPPKPGVRQQNNGGRVPVLFAHAPLPDGRTLIGEFDLDHLAGLLGQAPGRARLVDRGLRTISATAGYVAFEQVTDTAIRDRVTLAQRGDAVAGVDGDSVVTAAPVNGGEIGRLGWTVITHSKIANLALPENQTHRDASLVALLAALLAVLLFGWHHLALVLPLRRVASAADRIAGGELGEVVYPQRHDEIGTIASCLEICRQALVQGPDRLGQVRGRPRDLAARQLQSAP